MPTKHFKVLAIYENLFLKMAHGFQNFRKLSHSKIIRCTVASRCENFNAIALSQTISYDSATLAHQVT